MKSIKFLLLLLCSVVSQTLVQSQDIKTAVYFQTGQSKLDDNALQELQTVLELCQSYPDVALDIKAYADDRGSVQANIKLSNRRASEVFRYLKEKGLNPTKNIVDGLGELALSDESNVEEERGQNRRVDVVITPFIPRNFDEYYAFFKNRNTQKFAIKNNRDTTLIGKKGTVLFIPKNSFQTAEGDEVEVNLYEAYSYQDMLLQNLTTVSDGQMLETGGMVYIEAKRKSDGTELQLRPDQELLLTMPSSSPLPEGMQLFTAERNINQSAQAVNWKTDGTKFEQPDFLNTIKLSYNDFSNLLDQKHKLPEDLDMPDVNEKIVLNNPVKPAIFPLPMMTTSMPNAVESFENLAAKTPRREANSVRKKENNKQYENRLESVYRNLLVQFDLDSIKYIKALEDYNNALAIHVADSVSYPSRLADYEARMVLHENECSKIKNWLTKNKFTITAWTSNVEHLALLSVKGETIKKYLGHIKKLMDSKNQFKQEAQRAGFTDLLSSIDQLDVNLMDVKKAAIKLHWAVKEIDFKMPAKHQVFNKYSYREIPTPYRLIDLYLDKMTNEELLGVYDYYNKMNKMIPDFQQLISKFEEFSNDKALSSVAIFLEDLKEINNRFEAENLQRRRQHSLKIWENLWYDVLAEKDKNAYDKMLFEDRLLFSEDYARKQAEKLRLVQLHKMENDYLSSFSKEEKANYANFDLIEKERFMSDFVREQFNKVENTVGIKSLGWINCDRFSGQEMITLNIPAQKLGSATTKYYVCFKNIRSVLPLSNANNNAGLTAKVPKNATVQIVGVELNGGEVALSSTEGTVEKLNNQPLAGFKKVRMEELAMLIN